MINFKGLQELFAMLKVKHNPKNIQMILQGAT
jgi:hypothetical protein